MRYLLYFLSVLGFIHAQSPIHFQHTWDAGGFSSVYQIQPFLDGYVFCGFTDTTEEGSDDALIGRMDKSGAVVWCNRHGGANFELYSHLLVSSKHGDIYAIGRSNTTADSQYDLLLSRIDSSGNLLWTVFINGLNGERAHGMVELPSGDLLIAAETWSDAHGQNAIQLMRFDPVSKTVEWCRTSGVSAVWHDASVIKQVAPNHFWVIGRYNDGTYYNTIVSDWDSSGNLNWCRKYPLSATQNIYDACLIPFTDECTLAGTAGNDGLILRLNTSGMVTGASTYASTSTTWFTGIRYRFGKGWFVAGNSPGAVGTGAFLMHLKTSGMTYAWHQVISLPGNTMIRGMSNGSDLNYLLAGQLSTGGPEGSMVFHAIDTSGFSGDCNNSAPLLNSSNATVTSSSHTLTLYNTLPTVSSFLSVRSMPVGLIKTDHCPTVSVEQEFSSPLVMVYPSPASWEVHIELPNPAGLEKQVEIRDLQGRIVQRVPLVSDGITLSVGHLPDGIYQVLVWNGVNYIHGRFTVAH